MTVSTPARLTRSQPAGTVESETVPDQPVPELGGTAKATATDVNNIGTSVAEASATAGGSGFDFDTNGLAGVKATASATATGEAAVSVANAFGGGGGAELERDTGTSGNGAGATVTSSATGVTSANASANAYGGNGGGYTGAFFGAGTGGNGASISLDNAATGTTQGGTLTLEQDASGGGGGLSIGSAGGAGGSATSTLNDDDVANATANQSANITLTSIALAGAGGNAETTPGKAGIATVADEVSAAAMTAVTLNASATGGYGGSATSNGNGMVGGKASASAFDGIYDPDTGMTSGTALSANISATAAGRSGGNGIGVGHVGGNGGIATAGATATAVQTVTVGVSVQGGGGGNGTDGANGGNGAAEVLNGSIVAVNTSTSSIEITQTADAGYGGSSDTGTGGIGGAATSEETVSANTAAVFVVNDNAEGGNGGTANTDANGGAAGAAVANSTATGSGEVNINATADGGQSETKGGAATATLNATGHSSYSTAEAVAGGSEAAGAVATATATGDATTGTLEALANSSPHIINTPLLIDEISSKSTIGLYGSSATTKLISKFGSGLPASAGSPVGVAVGVAAPTGTAAILAANHNIQLAFGPHPTIFEIGELGGGYSGPTSVTQTTASSITETLDLAKLGASGNFALGLYGGAATDVGNVTQVVLTVTDVSTNNTLFTGTYTGAQALAEFTTDQAPTLNNPAFTNSGSAEIEVSLSVTTNAAGAAFSGDFIFGDPPSTQTIDVNGITDRAYTSARKTYTDGVLTSVAQYTSPGHLLQDVALSHNVGAFGMTGLNEAIHTNIANTTDIERDVYRDAAGHNEIVVRQLAGGALDIEAHVSGLTFNLATSFGRRNNRGLRARRRRARCQPRIVLELRRDDVSRRTARA